MPPAFLAPSYGAMGMPLPGVVLRPYAPPEVSAEEYARHFARETGAAAFAVTGVRDPEAILRDEPRPESRPRMQAMVQQGAALGGVAFECPDRGRCGLVDVFTLRMADFMGMNWSPFVTALIGPAAQWPHVRATLLQVARSYTADPAWQQRQSQASQASHQAVMASIETGNRILQIQAQSGMEAIRAHAQRAGMAAQAGADIDAMRAQS